MMYCQAFKADILLSSNFNCFGYELMTFSFKASQALLIGLFTDTGTKSNTQLHDFPSVCLNFFVGEGGTYCVG